MDNDEDRLRQEFGCVSFGASGGALASRALIASERRLRALIGEVAGVLVVLDEGLTVGLWSPGAREVLGWSAEEMTGRHVLDVVHPDDRGSISPLPPVGRREARRRICRVLHRDGTYRMLEAVVTNLLGEPELRAVIVHAREVTEPRGLAARAADSQALEGVVRLAGGVAHDFNNLLTVILSCGSLLAEELGRGGPGSLADVQEILAAAERASDLTQQLLAFARRQIVAPVVLDVGALLEQRETLLRRALGAAARLELRVGPGGWLVRCDPARLIQAIVDLVLHAREALTDGGRLEITTDNVEVAAGRAALDAGIPPGRYLRIRVRDDGPGLSEEARTHLFEPFFTTREGGTGLGLATVYGIVRQCGGVITVDGEVGRGTTFDVYLPRVEGAAEARPTGGSETLLVVEDDAAVARLTARVLRDAGYRVLSAGGGEEAIAVARAEPRVDLLVTDVVMPGLDGRQVAEALAAVHVGLRVLFLSGYAWEAPRAGREFLAKPFTPATLLGRVRTMLSGAEQVV